MLLVEYVCEIIGYNIITAQNVRTSGSA